MATATEAGRHWGRKSEACRILGIDNKALDRLIVAGGVSVRQIPGCALTVDLGECERIARESVRPARTGA